MGSLRDKAISLSARRCSNLPANDPGHPVVDRLIAMPDSEVFSALASEKRLRILDWLKDPEAHFPPQKDGDLVKDGVCVIFIADKLAVAQPTATLHLKTLARAGLVTSKRVGQW